MWRGSPRAVAHSDFCWSGARILDDFNKPQRHLITYASGRGEGRWAPWGNILFASPSTSPPLPPLLLRGGVSFSLVSPLVWLRRHKQSASQSRRVLWPVSSPAYVEISQSAVNRRRLLRPLPQNGVAQSHSTVLFAGVGVSLARVPCCVGLGCSPSPVPKTPNWDSHGESV